MIEQCKIYLRTKSLEPVPSKIMLQERFYVLYKVIVEWQPSPYLLILKDLPYPEKGSQFFRRNDCKECPIAIKKHFGLEMERL